MLSEGVREVYAELFALHTDACSQDRETIKGLVSRVTGREQRYVDLITTTFEMLCENSDFTPPAEVKRDPPPPPAPPKADAEKKDDDKKKDERKVEKKSQELAEDIKRPLTFAYNIQIHLPATTDIGVYNAIFKSLRDHLRD